MTVRDWWRPGAAMRRGAADQPEALDRADAPAMVLVLGVLQVFAAFSIWQGGAYGRWFAVCVAALSSIGALLSIPTYPFWSLAIFAVDVLIIYGLVAYGGQRRFAA
jgi:uncharacterized membrane protein (DUF2068 family)